MNKLSLEMSLGNSVTGLGMSLENTYRSEGLSVGANAIRLNGELLQTEVRFDELDIGYKIGQGACSSVKLATHKYDKTKYAIKMFNIYDNNQAKQLAKEIAVLATVQCDALVSLKGAFHHEGNIGVILEYMDRGSLEFILDPSVIINDLSMAAICYQVLWGLGYLHFENKLVSKVNNILDIIFYHKMLKHRDVKPANILINSQGFVKLSDFGISRELETSSQLSDSVTGTCLYMSPERLLAEHYFYTSDIWSVGILLIHLWDKKYPFTATNTIELLSEIEIADFSKIVSIKKYSKYMRQAILSMLAISPVDRPSCAELAESAWFLSNGITGLIVAHEIVRSWLIRIGRRNSNTNSESKSNNNSRRPSYNNAETKLSSNLNAISILESKENRRISNSSYDNEYDDDFENISDDEIELKKAEVINRRSSNDRNYRK